MFLLYKQYTFYNVDTQPEVIDYRLFNTRM